MHAVAGVAGEKGTTKGGVKTTRRAAFLRPPARVSAQPFADDPVFAIEIERGSGNPCVNPGLPGFTVHDHHRLSLSDLIAAPGRKFKNPAAQGSRHPAGPALPQHPAELFADLVHGVLREAGKFSAWRAMAARMRVIVSSTGVLRDTSSPRSRAMALTRAGLSGMPPRSMAAISCLARAISSTGLALARKQPFSQAIIAVRRCFSIHESWRENRRIPRRLSCAHRRRED